ncbi:MULTISPECIES: BMP family lipoprotein [Nocardiopsis]|uniref:BMP family ABC transporter substrate-binding protein n=2 Tax=Nocardiopsis alba TaxID=53437 RepID=A0A7K2IMY5_9ACTN|nr:MULTISPECIES: BMP family ABC transporter substrate-binding protein [Nocardiopsis]AFR10351.1 basic membrane family protein [Nocardiopsis alba ATCC BAA-2165]MEC3895517.1 BMP family ABC transporter substrate-binding protein [Nocardiopsis sp. LDBS1602]MYR31319.1 BMP family ABC transporter substrate-binding protein [Nocardiopsis alba]
MKRSNAAKFAAVAAASMLALTACDNAADDGSGDGSGDGDAASELKVGLAYDVGGRGDRSFNDSAFRGLEQAAEELGVQTQDFEPADGEPDSAKEERLTTMAEEGYDVIIAVGFAYDGAIQSVAPEYPEVDFAIVDSEVEGIDNVTSLVFAEEQASFLAGAAAALTTEEDHVGFIGGVETPLIHKFEAGFVAGAEHVNEDINVEIDYLSQPPDMSGFSDPARGREVAQAQYDRGADVIYHAAGASGNGVLESAVSNDFTFIGVDSDQYVNAEDAQKPHVLTSAIKQVDVSVFELISAAAEGDVEGGIQRFDLSDGGVDYTTSNEESIEPIQEELDALKEQIVAGEIEVPTQP